MITVSVSPRRRAILSPLLVRVNVFADPSFWKSIPSKITSLSTLHHHAGRPSAVRARTDVLVNALTWPAGPGRRQPSRGGEGGTKTWTLLSRFLVLGAPLRRWLRSSVGDRKAALDCVVEFRTRENCFSSSEGGWEVRDETLRLSSVGRWRRRGVTLGCWCAIGEEVNDDLLVGKEDVRERSSLGGEGAGLEGGEILSTAGPCGGDGAGLKGGEISLSEISFCEKFRKDGEGVGVNGGKIFSSDDNACTSSSCIGGEGAALVGGRLISLTCIDPLRICTVAATSCSAPGSDAAHCD